MTTRLRVLIVDDNPDDRALIARELGRGFPGLELVEVGDQAALDAALLAGRPDLVLTDYRLNWTDGLAVVRTLKARHPETAVIMVTGTGNEEVAVAAMKAGVEDYVVKKPQLFPRLPLIARAALERRLMEEQLRRAQQLEIIGRLAGGVAHDFNNLLTAILGYAYLLLEELPPDSPVRQEIEEIRHAGERGQALTRQLLAFSRRQLLQPQILDLNAVASQTERLLRRSLGEDVELVLELQPALWSVRCDPGQIEQALLNLAINARDAMPEGGRFIIATANHAIEPDTPGSPPGLAPGRYVRLSVRDTGHGMNADIKSHVFEPFFTTKGTGKGTGLGLPTVHGIVRQSGGDIEVDSAPGAGTTFRILLPAAGPTEAPRAAAAPARRGGETVLLVEDEDAVRSLARKLLERAGYRVLEACNGRDALAVTDAHPGRIDLVITDVVMPVMGGPELVGTLQGSGRRFAVLYTSGYTEGAALEQKVLAPGAAFLPKPFKPEALTRRVREILDTSGRA